MLTDTTANSFAEEETEAQRSGLARSGNSAVSRTAPKQQRVGRCGALLTACSSYFAYRWRGWTCDVSAPWPFPRLLKVVHGLSL